MLQLAVGISVEKNVHDVQKEDKKEGYKFESEHSLASLDFYNLYAYLFIYLMKREINKILI